MSSKAKWHANLETVVRLRKMQAMHIAACQTYHGFAKVWIDRAERKSSSQFGNIKAELQRGILWQKRADAQRVSAFKLQAKIDNLTNKNCTCDAVSAITTARS